MGLELFRSSFYTQMRSRVPKDQSPLRTSVSQESVSADFGLAGFAYFTHSAHFGLVKPACVAHSGHFGQADFAGFGSGRMPCSRKSRREPRVHANEG